MALIIADRVQETSTSTGTGAFTLGGAKTGFRTFASVLATNDTTYYTIVQADVGAWEVGLGTYSGVNTNNLTRTTVLASSNGNAAVNFGAGNKDVFISAAAAMLPPDPVRSFNGRTGNITPQQSDYDAFFATPTEAAAAAPVQSFNGRTGSITPQQADYDAFFTTPAEAAAAAPVQSVNGQTGAVVISAPTFAKGRLAANTTTNATAATAAIAIFTVAIPPGQAAHISANVASTTNATTVGSGIGIRLAQGAGASAAAQGGWSAVVGSAPAAGLADFFDGDIITAAAGATSSASVVNSVGSATAGTPVGSFLLADIHNPSTNATATASIIIHAEAAGTMAAFAGSAFTAVVG